MLSQFAPSFVRPLVSAALLTAMLAVPVAAHAEIAESTTAPRLDVPYVPTPEDVVERMLEAGKVSADDYVIDLGSGDGRILVTAAKERGARGFGVDIDPERIREARANAEAAGVTDKIEFRQQNLFETDIADATVLTMYLLPRINMELRPRILDELRPGTRVVSHDFNMGEWTPDRTEEVGHKRVYLWIVPAKADGDWTMEVDGRKVPITLRQNFQKLEGSARVDDRDVPVAGELKGSEIALTTDLGKGATTYEGRVDGDTIAGSAGWTARRD